MRRGETDFTQHRTTLLTVSTETPSHWALLGDSDCGAHVSLEVRVVHQSPAPLLDTEDAAVILRHVSPMAPAIFVCLLCP